jgi:hypothetical protein
MIAALMAAKTAAIESDRKPLHADTRAWLEREIDTAQRAASTIRTDASLRATSLDEVFRATVKAT